MALTPEDVVNKRFQPTKFREGYDQDEVDDFLDEIVVELRRLNQENDDLRRRLSDSPAGTSQNGAVPAPIAASAQGEEVSVEATSEEPDAAEPSGAEPTTVAFNDEESASVPAPAATGGGSAESAAGVLAMAQRLHDEYVNAGVEQRDQIIANAQEEATSMVDEAQETSRKTLGDLEEQKALLERKVEQLRGFERDYRSRLKAYIEGQLRDLDSHGSVASVTAKS